MPNIRHGCGRFTIRRWCYMCAEMSLRCRSQELRLWARVIQHGMAPAWLSGWAAIWQLADLRSLADWPAGWTRLRMAAQSRQKEGSRSVWHRRGLIYPKENSRLADQILSMGGALISEFPLTTFAAPQNFHSQSND